MALLVEQFVDDFGAKLDVGVVHLLKVVRTAVGGGKVMNLFLFEGTAHVSEQFFEVVVEEGRAFAVGKNEELVGGKVL